VTGSSSIEIFEPEAPNLEPEVLRGLAQFRLYEPMGSELALELGLSIWMRRSGADLYSLRTCMLGIRDALVEVGNLDPVTEPIPLLGHSERTDVVNLAAYLGGLVRRAASSVKCGPEDIAEQAISHLGGRATAGVIGAV
jgi:hypothetical protein